MKHLKMSGTILIATIYGIVFILWIFYRNKLLYLWGKTDAVYTASQTNIDIVFALITALSIYFLIRYYRTKLLKETNELINFIDNTSAVIFAKNKDGKYFFINREFEKLFNEKKEDLIGKTDYEIFDDRYAEKFIANDKKVFEEKKSITFEEVGPEEDGDHTYLSIKFPIRDLKGKVYAIGGVTTDITERKRIEKELEYSLALSRATLESTADGILVVDREGNISGKNQKFVEMWNIPKSLDKSHNDSRLLEYVLNQLQSPDMFLEKVNKLYKTPEEESFDTIEFKDGRVFERFSKPQVSGEEIIGRVWSFRDITERVRNEEKNKQRVIQMTHFQEVILELTGLKMDLSLNEKFDQIIKLTAKALEVERTSIWLYDEKHTMIYTDKIYSLSKNSFHHGFTIDYKSYPVYFEAIENSPAIDAHDAYSDPRVIELLEDYLKHLGITSMLDTPIRTGGQIIGILCLEHTGPKRKWTHEELVFSSSIAGIIALAIEHEQRKRAEQKIRQNEEKYRFLSETVPQLIWAAQPDGYIDFFNSNVYEYIGKDFEDLKGWQWKNYVHPDDIEKTMDAWNESIKTGKPYLIEYRLIDKNGNYRWHIGRAVPQTNGNGKIIKWFGSATDIHEQKEASEALKLKNEELKKTNHDLDNFIYTASHDLKAPISNIEGLINMLKGEDSVQNEEINSILNLMGKSTERFKKTIATLTDVAKIQKDVGEDVEEISLEKMLKEIMEDIKEVKENNAVIKHDFKEPTIKFSKKNLRSVFYNLISNAIKYRDPDRIPEIKISTDANHDYTIVTIKDNGLGIKKSSQDKIFKMFTRLHTHVEGTGIGLYIVKRIMDNAGGKIELESKVNEGTTFTLYFKNLNGNSS